MRGLVIGKFMPVHAGHLALLDFAQTKCDELIVSMSYTSADPIDASLRIQWLTEIFKNNPKVSVKSIVDDFDESSLPWDKRTRIWANVITKVYPKIDVLISSEEYGEYFAGHLGAKHIMFDQDRLRVPISATNIRTLPMKNWEFIPPVVRPHFLKKFCLYGAESTGKSEMTKKLAAYYNTDSVPEVAREMITSNEFTLDDIIRIGKAQNERVQEKSKVANKILFCDTDLITTQIYSKYYLGAIPEVLYDLEKQVQYDHYFLFDIDVPWVADGLRDLGDRREEMHKLFKDALEARGIRYTMVKGDWNERFLIIKQVVDQMISEELSQKHP